MAGEATAIVIQMQEIGMDRVILKFGNLNEANLTFARNFKSSSVAIDEMTGKLVPMTQGLNEGLELGGRRSIMLASNFARMGETGTMSIRSMLYEMYYLKEAMGATGAEGALKFGLVGAAAIGVGMLLKHEADEIKETDEAWKAAGQSAQGYFDNIRIGLGIISGPQISGVMDFHAVGQNRAKAQVEDLQRKAKELEHKSSIEEKVENQFAPDRSELGRQEERHAKHVAVTEELRKQVELQEKYNAYYNRGDLYGNTAELEKKLQRQNKFNAEEERNIGKESGNLMAAQQKALYAEGYKERAREIHHIHAMGQDSRAEQAALHYAEHHHIAVTEEKYKQVLEHYEEKFHKIDAARLAREENLKEKIRTADEANRPRAEQMLHLSEKVSKSWQEASKDSHLGSMDEEGTVGAYKARAEYMSSGDSIAEKTLEANMMQVTTLEQILIAMRPAGLGTVHPTIHGAGGSRR